jgi:hypothetical protein
MRRRFSILLAGLFALIAPPSMGNWSGILAPERASDWTLAGIPGGIPERTTVCQTVAAGAASSTIQTAINNCPVGQVVQLSAGTYNSVNINIPKGIVLRGAGANATTLNLSDNIILGNGTSWIGSWPSSPAQVSWTGGLTQGSTVITVSSASGLSVGQTIIIDELNPSWVNTGGNRGTCGSSNTCGRNDNPVGFGGGADSRAHLQMTVITAINGTSITIRDPVSYTRSADRSPMVFYWSNPGNIQNAGIEDVFVNANSRDYAINMAFCTYCWVKGVRVDNLARTAVLSYYGYGNIIRDSYINSTNTGAPTQYGFESIMSGNLLIENNIIYNVTSPIMPEASSGVVFGYNYIHNAVSGNLFASVAPHLAHSSFALVEGNDVDKIHFDNVWGSASHGTVFRNRANGVGANKLNYRVPLAFASYQWYMNAVGNVLGDTSHHTTYSCHDGNRISGDSYIYDLGYFYDCVYGGDTDPGTRSTLMRWGNWDAMHENTLYCSAAGGNCASDERGSTAATFPALANPSQAFPASFYLAGAPAWWGDVAWPPIGPDVTCVTNCVTNAGGKAHKIPARLCYESSPKNASGYLTEFDPEVCYAETAPPPDTTPPAISSTLPAGEQASGTTQVTLQVTTNEAATCRHDASDVAYASMSSTFETTGGTTHQQTGFGVSDGQNYLRYVRCIDGSGNANTTSSTISFSVASAPSALTISSPLPASGTTLPKQTKSTTIGVTSSANASCRWGYRPGIAWGSLTAYTTTGGTTHTSSLPTTDGGTYQICSRCYDTAQYSDDLCTFFSIATQPKRWRWW